MSDEAVAAAGDASILRFDEGIPGFADARNFVLHDLTEDGVFQQMTCLEDPELAFVVLYPWLAFPDYSPELPESDQQALGITNPAEAVVFCSVLIDEEEGELFANLRAPFIAHARTLTARQVVLSDESLPMRAPLTQGT